MTANQLCQALRPYTCHWVFWAAIILWLVHYGLLPWASQRDFQYFVWMSLMASTALGTGIGAMLKLQFANPRARLVPNFRTAHLVATGGLVGALLAIEVALGPVWCGVAPRLALLSVALLAMVAGAWFAYSMISALWLLVAPLILVPAFAPQILVGATQALISNPLISLGIIAIGVVGMAALGARLWILSEESQAYSWQMPSGDIMPRLGDRNLLKLEARVITRSRYLTWRLDQQFGLIVRGRRSMGWLRRLLFRQLAGGYSILPIIPTLLIVFWLQSDLEPPFDPGQLFFVAFFPLQLVLLMVGSVWRSRCWPLLAAESLRPLRRREFVRDQAHSLACDLTQSAATHCLLIFVYVRFIFSQDPSSELLLPWIVLTIVQYIVVYCLMLWLVSYRGLWSLIFGVSGISGLSSAVVIAALFAEPGFWSPLNLAVTTIATTLAAVLLYRMAFRRWCHVDLA